MKLRISIAVFVFMIVANFAIEAQVISGDFFFDKSTPGYTLDKNSGMRIVEREINFPKPFETKPFVTVTPTLIDAAKSTQLRYSIEAKGVSRDGFVVKIATWGETQINGIGGFWVAQAEKLEIKKEEIKVGTTIQLNNVYFEFNKWNLLPESFPELDKVFQFLKDNPTVEIELSGHTDNIGSDEYNLNLSQKRADAVKAYIVSKGIDTKRMTSKGYGKSKPIATNMTDAGREQNRRVEFTVTKK
jgi:outer membrane protein OmpA-like peptidoglycan-associated protein